MSTEPFNHPPGSPFHPDYKSQLPQDKTPTKKQETVERQPIVNIRAVLPGPCQEAKAFRMSKADI